MKPATRIRVADLWERADKLKRLRPVLGIVEYQEPDPRRRSKQTSAFVLMLVIPLFVAAYALLYVLL